MNHLSYAEALIVGAFQGVTELFPVSSLGHSVLVPALIGGRWAQDLNVSTPESPYLAFLVGLHMATAGALLVFFWRDWLAILAGFATSLRYRRIQTPAERLAWLIVLATIPVGISGLALEHLSRTILGKPIPAAVFLTLNGIILYAGERLRRRAAIPAPATADTPAPTDDPPLSLSTSPMTGWPACPCPKGW
jgi:undecaprenyl-diphosphatase